MATTRRTFTPEFKAQAVKLVTEGGGSLAEVARDLDLGESLLRAWKQALTKDGRDAVPGKGNPPAPEEELRRPRAEVKRLTMERDILKKATAFLARGRHEVRLRRESPGEMAGPAHVPGPARLARRLPRLAGEAAEHPGSQAGRPWSSPSRRSTARSRPATAARGSTPSRSPGASPAARTPWPN
jgi:transposase